MIKLYLFSKKIHRLCMVFTIALTVLMAGTGLLLKFSAAPLGLNLGLVRYLHNQLSIWFSVALAVMALSGLVLYVFPFWQRRQVVKKNSVDDAAA